MSSKLYGFISPGFLVALWYVWVGALPRSSACGEIGPLAGALSGGLGRRRPAMQEGDVSRLGLI